MMKPIGEVMFGYLGIITRSMQMAKVLGAHLPLKTGSNQNAILYSATL